MTQQKAGDLLQWLAAELRLVAGEPDVDVLENRLPGCGRREEDLVQASLSRGRALDLQRAIRCLTEGER